jgi:hypothetical protein
MVEIRLLPMSDEPAHLSLRNVDKGMNSAEGVRRVRGR